MVPGYVEPSHRYSDHRGDGAARQGTREMNSIEVAFYFHFSVEEQCVEPSNHCRSSEPFIPALYDRIESIKAYTAIK